MSTEQLHKLNIILFGPPAVGKSTVGAVFRDEFGFNFYDGDDEMTPEERAKVSRAQWDDTDRRQLLIRMGETIRRLHHESAVGLVTSVALTRQWMRDFLNEQAGGFLRFVLVTTTLQLPQLEALVAKRHAAGHSISVDSFHKFTSAFETPAMPYLILKNPQDKSKQAELIAEVRRVISELEK